MADHHPRKLAAILHADVVGSTELVQRNESVAHERIQDSFRRLSTTINAYGGITQEIRGDALLAEFARASDAVIAAIAFQIENTASNSQFEDDIQPVLRIGISLGEVIVSDDTITGAGVVLAQRLEQLADPGGIVVQGSVSETVPARFPIDYESLGEHTLKGFEQPVRAFIVRLKPGEQIPDSESNAASPEVKAKKARQHPPLKLPDKPSIVVLPFTNMSSDPEQEYFSDGVSEDIITDLSKMSGLFVIARNSAFAYKDKATNVPAICQKLGVKFALEGSIRKAGNRVRITAQLIDGTTGGHLWAERYDRELTDIFEVQDDVTQQIVNALKITLSEAEKTLFVESGPKNVDSHDLFMRGRQLLFGLKRDRKMFDTATAYFRRAIELDPDYAGPYAGMGMAYMLDHQNHWSDSPETSLDEAERFVEEAIARDDKDPYAHCIAALVAVFRKDYERWTQEADKALSLNPNYALAINARGMVHIYTGEPTKAIPYIERAIRLDPAYQQYIHFLGTAYFVAGDYETAATLYKDRISITPTTDFSRAFLASALGHLGELEEAHQVWGELKEINPEYSPVDHIRRLPFRDLADAEKFTDGLKKAGLME
ncbi:MAG: adenylate/guanylate cyclase domain-containing protein [Arenicellales bacterium]|nr:adenylate/guanylate cyclase domain-containing protein [Arenicellales bacterium]